ncbi:hypothetical protein [Enterovirga sp.]|uniref:hypothetical protein n=1 Tax=Enterovirga sp. TaxID=2026350 RepID=UPI00262839AC|nr:hypothetical protein [Enterovirga sp.]MDB5591996.1 hypothetical protein [Enterovirga sp.]
MKAAARRWLEAAGVEGAELTVSEITCPDPACPGDETVILVLQAGRRSRAAKVRSPARDVTDEDVRSALLAAGFKGPE